MRRREPAQQSTTSLLRLTGSEETTGEATDEDRLVVVALETSGSEQIGEGDPGRGVEDPGTREMTGERHQARARGR